MYCHKCGKEVGDVKYCPNCGTKLTLEESFPKTVTKGPTFKDEDKPSWGYAILSGFFQLFGLFFYFILRKEYPLKARSCIRGVVIGTFIYSLLFAYLIVQYENNKDNPNNPYELHIEIG